MTRGGGYLLTAAPEQIDAERFEAIAADARRALAAGDASGARKLLGEALGLWRGEPLADLAYEPFAQREIARLEEARLAALEDRIDADLALGHHRDLVGELEDSSRRTPTAIGCAAQLMLALYRSGRQADALEAYRRGRARAGRARARAGARAARLEQRILTHDPALAAPATVEPAARADRTRTTARADAAGC